ncbi:conserved hypothetical protein [Burkholderiales bacterium 8X]|nr:conserved hypothetical protein [Burkholderiales bacterium 8X]
MRIFGYAALLLALVIVALLAKNQLSATLPAVVPAQPATTGPGSGNAAANGSAISAPGQAKPIQQQYKEALDAALQTPRPMPDE